MSIKGNIMGLVLCLQAMMPVQAKTYYVSARGNDSNAGTSPSSCWQTLMKLNGFPFKPGDKIAFRAGERFTGVLEISASGAPGRSITYTSYGVGMAAIIDGNGDSSAIYSFNKQYIDIDNLAVTNYRNGTMGMNDLFNGIYIVNRDAGILHHFHLNKVKVFRVNSTHLAKDEGKTDQSRFHGGVQFRTIGNRVRSNFDDILVVNCSFEDLSRTGVNFRSDWDDRSAYSRYGDSIGKGMTDNWTPNTRVVFRRNKFRRIAGNGLIVRVAVNALIEHNLFDSCGTVISGNAVFNFNTDGTLYQFNEAKHTIYNDGDTDARGIDSDYRTKNTVIQYNYLHDNGLGGITATGGPGTGDNPVNFNLNTIIRYNIIENNARQGAYFSGRVEGLQVYNNIFFADERFDNVVVLKLNKWTVYPDNAVFSSNIFFFEGKNSSYAFTNSTNLRFQNNLYAGVAAPVEFPDRQPVLANPEFQNAGKGEAGYKLKATSPARKAGTAILNNVDRDYYGKTFNRQSQLNIGIQQ